MGSIHWEQVDKLRDVVALTRAQASDDQDAFLKLLDPYMDDLMKAARGIYNLINEFDEAEALGKPLPDPKKRWEVLGDAAREWIDLIRAFAVMSNALAHHYGKKVDMTSDEVLETWVSYFASFNPSQFPLDIDDIEDIDDEDE